MKFLSLKLSANERSTMAVQAIAAVLIANSHLEAFYPRSWMAADGLLGNALFFFLSGYGLARSSLRTNRSFADYYVRRLLRVYPSLWCICLIVQVGICGNWREWSVADYLRALLFPGKFTYIQQILVYCVPFYFLLKSRNQNGFVAVGTFLFVMFAGLAWNVVHTTNPSRLELGTLDPRMWWIFFFLVMLLGGMCGMRPEWERGSSFHSSALGFAITFPLYVAVKFAMVKGWHLPGGVPVANCFFVLHLLTFVMVWTLVRAAVSSDLQNWLGDRPRLHAVTAFVGGLTLEVYLINWFLAHWSLLADLIFPLNVACFAVATLLLSWLVSRMATGLRHLLEAGISTTMRLGGIRTVSH